ncbi:MAG TPA: ectonucleotide pyrophosphatase/phosphodiesterase [Pyrinomonadaceae bacterium]|nr:ectonucleotide pyrophosphatase/phosphodiesterase [Pyrinomonadaceae bacterium]
MKHNHTRHTRRLALVLLVLALALGLGGISSAQPKARRAIIISLDGLDVRYLEKRDEYGLKIPTLRRLMGEGVWGRVVGVYPSVTYPSHTTIVTGATPSRHAINGNELFERPDQPQTGSWNWFARDIRAETLWDAAGRGGLKTALISWPVGAGAGDFNFPEIWKPGGTREETREVIRRNARPSGLVEELERRDPALYRNVNKDEGDDMRTRFAEYVVGEKKPELLLVHLFDLDHFEHEAGPFTPEAFAILEKVDGYVGRILAAAERAGTLSETAVFVVSDHGFSPISKQILPGVILARAGLLKLGQDGRTVTDWRAAAYINGGSCAIVLRDPRDRDAYRKALAAFKEFAGGEGRGALRVLGREELRRRKTYPNAAFALEAAEGYYFDKGTAGEAVVAARIRGQHGYVPERYYTSFIANGAGVTRRGSFGTIRLIDEGPTIARALGLKLRDAEGRALSLK